MYQVTFQFENGDKPVVFSASPNITPVSYTHLDLDAGGGVDRGEEICGIGEGKLLLRAVFGNGIVDGAFGQARNYLLYTSRCV